MITWIKYCTAIILMAIVTLSCGVTDPTKNLQARPTALGKMNEIVVITDDIVWHSVVGDTIDYFFGEVYPITPSPEPTFNLRRFDVGELSAQPLKKQLRTYMVVANLEDENSLTSQFVRKDLGEERYQRALTDPTFHTSIGRDKWANGQVIIYVFANSLDDLAAAIEKSYDGIAAKILEHDAEQLYQSAYSRGEGLGYIEKAKHRYGAKVVVPGDYKLALDMPEDNGLTWYRRDIKESVMNIAIRQYPYNGPQSITKDAIKANFNDFGKYVHSDIEDTYILINDVDLPMLSWDKTIGGRFAREFRGIWEMENDFMGGPFLSYVIVNEDEKKMLQIDGFIMAPGKAKRNMMQQIELIANKTEW